MKKILVLLMIVSVLMVSGCSGLGGPSSSPSPSLSPSASPSSAPSPSPSLTPSPTPSVPTTADYFPMTPNVHLSYKGEGNEFAGFEAYVEFINNGALQLRNSNGGTETVEVYQLGGGMLTKVFSQGETYYVQDFTAMSTMSDILIKEPIAVGTAWTSGSGDVREITDISATVTVPYGTLSDVLEVTTTLADSTIKEYYAPGIGLVKRDFIPSSDPQNPITSELQAHNTNTPQTQTIGFYYPDFNNNQIVYVNKAVEFFTNDTAASKFDTAFKNVPAGSGLTPLISAGTVINGLAFDTNTNVATVDVSETFISEMNAGSSLEAMLLESVGNTIGNYFQTEQVQIRIDGGDYMSGHFGFALGDFLPYNPNDAVPYTP